MKIIVSSLCLVLCLIGRVAAANSIVILGLPLGEKINPLKQCPELRINAEYRELCWVYAPVEMSSGKWGVVGLPGADRRPPWAAHALFEVRLAKDETLESFDVKTFNDRAFLEIFNSITARFGHSDQRSRTVTWASTARWDRRNVEIGLRCAPGAGCKSTFTFIPRANRAARARAIANHQAEVAAKPILP